MSKRIDFYDVAKGIAILSVILFHSGVDIECVRSAILSYSLQMFFVIAGIFFRNNSLMLHIKSKGVRLIKPYIYTCVVMIIISAVFLYLDGATKQVIIDETYNWILASIYGAGISYNLWYTWFGANESAIHIHWWNRGIGAIWFLLALYWSFIFLQLSLRVKYSWLLVAMMAFISCYTADVIWLPFSIQAGMFATVFVFLGYQIKTYNLQNYLDNKIIIIISGVLWITGLYFGFGDLYMVMNFFGNVHYDYILYIVTSCIGSYFVLGISKFISDHNCWNNNVNSFLLFCGRNSLFILCAHIIALNLIPWHQLASGYIQIFVCNVLFAVLATCIINKPELFIKH